MEFQFTQISRHVLGPCMKHSGSFYWIGPEFEMPFSQTSVSTVQGVNGIYAAQSTEKKIISKTLKKLLHHFYSFQKKLPGHFG